MFEPDRRYLLVDALRPPPGARLDAAVGTTFSLDLEALLLAPVTFALFEARLAETGDPSRSDPLAIMEAVRRHADQIDLFCQAGQIALPPRDRPVLALLEESVHPTVAPAPGLIFHPKVWALRFVGKAGFVYRLLVLSRNLTFDRSWDLVVALDGFPAEGRAGLRETNQPLADFVRLLPELATRPLSPERVDRIDGLADQLLDVDWTLPTDFSKVRFVPSGIPGYRSVWPDRVDRALLVSPFLTNAQLERVVAGSGPTTLVSRPESLDRVTTDLLDRFDDVYVLADGIDPGSADEEVDEREAVEPATPESSPVREELGERPGVLNSGLHAKLLVVDHGWYADVRVGSTNATTAGWSGNVEFDVSLTGPRGKVGVDAIVGAGSSRVSLVSMLAKYRRDEPDPVAASEAEKLAVRLEQVGREIAALPMTARVEPDGELYRLTLDSGGTLPSSDDLTIRCWPISRHPNNAFDQTPGQPVHLSQGALSLQALTSFFAFEVTGLTAERPVSIRVVANARLLGAPADRSQRLLVDQLRTKGDVLRYLLFLLADLGDEGAARVVAGVLLSLQGDSEGEWKPNIPVFETLVRALSRNPEALGPIERLITDLGETPEGASLLPDGLDEIWPAIWEARNRIHEQV